MPSRDVNQGFKETQLGTNHHVIGYESGVALKVLERMAEGETLASVCREDGMPSRVTVWRWVQLHPEFARAFDAARTLSAMAFEEKALGLAIKLKDKAADLTGTMVRAYEVAMGQFRWSAARRDPGKYAQQNTVNLSVPIQINTTLDLGTAPGSRNTKEYPDIYRIEAKVAPEVLDGDYSEADMTAPQDAPEDVSTPIRRDLPKARPPRPRKIHLKGPSKPRGKALVRT